MIESHFILYVADQRKSREFYAAVLGHEPTLDVPGMTEFDLVDGAILGLMPEDGIARLLGEAIEHPSRAAGVARSELYLLVDDAAAVYASALAAGAREVSPLSAREWGHSVAYSLDPDGHVLAIASSNVGT